MRTGRLGVRMVLHDFCKSARHGLDRAEPGCAISREGPGEELVDLGGNFGARAQAFGTSLSHIRLKVSGKAAAANGSSPVIIRNKTTASDQTSVLKWSGSPRACSGLMYGGDPRMVLDDVASSSTDCSAHLAMPKSRILTTSRVLALVRKMLLGLTSR